MEVETTKTVKGGKDAKKWGQGCKAPGRVHPCILGRCRVVQTRMFVGFPTHLGRMQYVCKILHPLKDARMQTRTNLGVPDRGVRTWVNTDSARSTWVNGVNRRVARIDLVPADPMFTRLIADLRLLRTHEPADGSDWPEWLEPRSFRRLMQYLLTLECPEREREE